MRAIQPFRLTQGHNTAVLPSTIDVIQDPDLDERLAALRAKE